MKSGFLMLSLAILLEAGAAPVFAATVESRPQKAIVYRDGYAILEEKLEAQPQTAIRLPASTDLASVRVFLDGKRTGSLQFDRLMEEEATAERTVVQGVVVERSVRAERLVGYLLRPGLTGKKGPLTLRYGTTGISWQPGIDVEILDGSRVAVTLTALITNDAQDLRDCRVQLASGAGPMASKHYFQAAAYRGYHPAGNALARSADLIYDAGMQTVEKDKPALVTVMSATSRYARKLVWNTDTRDRVQVVLAVTNPFSQPVCPAPASLSRNGVLIGQDGAEWAAPGEPIVLAAGHDPGIEVERSVDTTENLANRARPFRHVIQFKVTNHGSGPVSLEAIMPKKFGSLHKTLYRFKREPDRRPGELFIWDLGLKKGQTEIIAFSFDSEHPRFAGYESYEKARHEMF